MSIEKALKQAGFLGLPFSWGDDGKIEFDTSIPNDQQDAIRAVVAANLPNEAKEKAWEAIKLERDRRIAQGGYKVGMKWYHSDQLSRIQQLGLVQLGSNMPSGLQWKTMDGTFVPMTPLLAGQILAAAAASDQATFIAAETHKAAMEASTDPFSYNFTAGWPEIFEA